MRKILRRAFALILMCTLIMGQLMVGDALAASDVPVLSESGGEVTADTAEGGSAVVVAGTGGEGSGDEANIVPEEQPVLLAAGEEPAVTLGNGAADGGLTVNISSSQTGVVHDGDSYTFTVTVADSDLLTAPNITPGEKLTIKLPSYLTAKDMDAVLQKCFGYFEKDYTYDAQTNTLVLTFKQNASGQWVNVQFSITMTVSTIGYDGEGKGSIEVGLGDYETGTGSVDVPVDTGTGTGTGGEGEEGKPYLDKKIWSNYKLSEYAPAGEEDYAMRDPDAPIGYAVLFGVNKNYTGSAVITDDLSDGNLALCDSSGKTDAALINCFRLYVEGVKLTGTADGDGVRFMSAELGTITITRGQTGFQLTCTPAVYANDTAIVHVVLRYFAIVTGDINELNNNVILTIDDNYIAGDGQAIRRYDNEGLVITKSIKTGENSFADTLDLPEGQNTVTFRLTLTQYGTGSIYKAGDIINYDQLADYFNFNAAQVTISQGAPFTLSPDGQRINILKAGGDPIASGVYTIDFTVGIDLAKLGYGQQGTNTVGSTVVVRRPAKIVINKTWAGENINRGAGAAFSLYNGATLVSDSGAMSAGDSFTLYISADKLADGTRTYALRETIDAAAGYMPVRDIDVVITKSQGTVTIVSIGGTAYNSGSAEYDVENVPDSGKGTLTFKKYGGSVSDANLLDGGMYQLYRVEAAGDVPVETFSTVNGVKVFEELPYGTYYIKEISAPSGYLIEGTGKTGNVTLLKTAPHQNLRLINTLYKNGSISILKKDDKGAALANVAFSMTDAAGKTSTGRTGADGSVSFTGLTAGVYSISETLPEGYSGFAGPVIVTIDTKGEIKSLTAQAGAAVTGSTISINWSNVQLFGSVRLTKTGATTAVKLPGAVFALYDNAGTQVGANVTTDANGVAEFKNLPYGSYTLKELTPPEGYVLSPALAAGVALTIASAQPNLELNYSNDTQKGGVTVTKTDAGTGAALSGAVFGLYSDAGATALIAQKTTGTNGVCAFTGLEAGVYYVREISAPTGYQLNTEIFKFNVGVAEAGSTAAPVWALTQTVTDAKRVYNVQLRKTAEDGATPLAGAEFRLTGGGFNLTATSGADGYVTFSGLPFGSYTVTETKAPSGYALSPAVTVKVDGSNTPAVYAAGQTVNGDTVKDTHTRLTVLKVDDANQNKGLPGTKFVIKSGNQFVTATGANGAYSYTGLGDTGTELVTGNDGRFTLEYLPLGSYTLTETAAPDGYIIVNADTAFRITAAASSVTVGNTLIQAKLSIVKTDEYGKLLPGIGFTLHTAEGYVRATGNNGSYKYTGLGEKGTVLYTGTDGRILLTGLLWGEYTIDEVAATTPAGLTPVTGRTVSVTAAEQSTTIGVAIENRRVVGDVAFNKVDAAGEALPGAVFKLELVSGSDYSGDEARYAVSGANGAVIFEDVPYGVYKLTEYLAPYGKQLSTAVYYVSVGGADAGEQTVTETPFDWTNDDLKLKVTVKKTSTGGAPLTGAIFRITDENGNTVLDDVAVNAAEGAEIELPVGVYYIIEKQAPANYVLDETPVRFEVTERGPNEITLKNAPFTGSLTITKADAADNGKLLSGAEFKVYVKADYAMNGTAAAALYTVTTNSDGTATVSGLPFGEYAVAETRAPAGYELDQTPQYFTVGNGEGAQGQVTLSFGDVKSRYVLAISKEDIGTHARLAGARFAVSGAGFYTEAVTGEDGTVTVEVPALGTYNIAELVAPAGYTIDPSGYQVTVTSHTPEGAAAAAVFTSEDYPTSVRLYKVDENGAALDGAYFQIFSEAGELMSYTVDENGVYIYTPGEARTDIAAGSAVIQGLLSGAYILREIASPDNYMSLGDISFTVEPDAYDRAVELTAANVPYEREVAVCKENESGVRLAGAEFSIYGADGALIEAVTTAASGYAIFTGLQSGSYTIKETAAPAGYQLDNSEYAFTVDENGVLQSERVFTAYGEGEDVFYVLGVTDKAVEQSFSVKKVSSLSGAALAGAQFRLLGNGVNATYTTGENGLTEKISLPVGEYMLTEVRSPEGYVGDAAGHHVRVTADGVEIDGAPLEGAAVFTAANEPAKFRLAIEKIDEASGAALRGAAFTVTGGAGEKFSLTTDENGLTESIQLVPGTYAVTEAIAPSGYNIPLAGWSFTVDEGTMQVSRISGDIREQSFENGLLTLTIANTRTTGSLLIYKHDAFDKELPLSGAQFKLLGEDGAALWFTVKNGVYTVADKTAAGAGNLLTTNALGQALLDGLEFGNYTVSEVKAPEGYRAAAEGLQIKLTAQDETLRLDVPNELILANVTVVKQSDGETPENLIGAVFALYSVAEDGSRQYLDEATTLYDGRASFTVPYGDYLIAEVRAPEGYELSAAEPWSFSFNADTQKDYEFTYTFKNEKSNYSIEVYKHDADDAGKALAGAEFAFTDSRGFTKVVATGADGIARLENAAYDDYTVREITAPDGYYLSDQVFTVAKEELTHNRPLRLDAADTLILGSVTLRKVDSEDSSKLLDAEFSVFDADGAALCWTETEDGYALSAEGETLIHAGEAILSGLPAGEYSIREITAPDGYLTLDGDRAFAINAGNALAGVEIEIENIQRKTAVGIIKMDSADRTIRLAGAEFTLYTLVDGVAGEAVTVEITDKNGLAVFTGLTMGDYRIVETAAPFGYKLWETPVDFSIDADGNVTAGKDGVQLPAIDMVYTAGVLNENITRELTVKKLDADDGSALAGASFTVTGGGKSWRVTTGKDGTAKISLPYGEYIVQELIAPDGYVLDETKYLVEVGEKGISVNGAALTELTLVIKNAPVEYPIVIHKQDSVSGAALSGAVFTVTGAGGPYKLTTNASGDTDSLYLKPGKYSISETSAPSGYKQPIGGWTLTVGKDGKISITGDGAAVAVSCCSATVTVENAKLQPSGPNIAKTGEMKNNSLLLSGAAIMLLSFSGLMALLFDERRRRKLN